MTKNYKVDVLIAGQGAASFAAGLYTSRYQLNTLIVGEHFGGETAIGGLIENYPGQPDIDGFDLMLKFKEQIDNLKTPIHSSNLVNVEKKSGKFYSTLEDGTQIESISLILGIGRERRKLGLENEDSWTGKGISYCSTCDAPLYKNKSSVAVVGGGNAAVEGALLLSKYAEKIYLIYRKDKFTRPEPILLKILDQTSNIDVLFNTEITSLLGNDILGLKSINISKNWEGKSQIDVDGLFIEAGADPRIDIPKKLGLELNSSTNEVHVDIAQKTSIEGVFAAGDLTDGTELKQTITAASQGAISALSAYQYVSEYNSSN
ncbi:MAG: thioredoxin reductase [Dehalococcoidia bacterium]|nr:thioredoxin reductase [Dehalococcoidia bacterium]MQG09196.1 thioredoxin reductase [SAR202 cluster bacterium]|tara:strand:- start:60 stop:1013 length:954 start_codon:yes stop_codon:yes gene_type:complete